TAFLQRGVHGDRSEEADAPPSRGEVGPEQAAIGVRTERRNMRCTPAAIEIVPVAPKRLGVRHAEEGTERNTEDPLGFGQIALGELTDNRFGHQRDLSLLELP